MLLWSGGPVRRHLFRGVGDAMPHDFDYMVLLTVSKTMVLEKAGVEW